jgi:hypothetical protein
MLLAPTSTSRQGFVWIVQVAVRVLGQIFSSRGTGSTTAREASSYGIRISGRLLIGSWQSAGGVRSLLCDRSGNGCVKLMEWTRELAGLSRIDWGLL